MLNIYLIILFFSIIIWIILNILRHKNIITYSKYFRLNFCLVIFSVIFLGMAKWHRGDFDRSTKSEIVNAENRKQELIDSAEEFLQKHK